jgi:hypothetical protein
MFEDSHRLQYSTLWSSCLSRMSSARNADASAMFEYV